MKKLTLEEKKEIARREMEKDFPKDKIKSVFKFGKLHEYELFGFPPKGNCPVQLFSVLGYGVNDAGEVKCAYPRDLGNINFDNSRT